MSNADLIKVMDEQYWEDHQVDGITYCRWMHNAKWAPDRSEKPNHYYGYDTGADNALFTGMYLAAASYRYAITRQSDDLNKLYDTLMGIHLLTHITPIPGVLVRLAFPLKDSYRKIGYDEDNLDEGNTWTRRRLEGSIYQSETHFYYTKTTRDQLTGIVYGLTVAWKVINDGAQQITASQKEKLHEIRINIINIVNDLTNRLKSENWSLKDNTGYIGKTNAHKPNTQLRYALLLLHASVNGQRNPKEYKLKMKLFFKFIRLHTFYYGLTRNMYAFNLRYMIAYTLYNLEEKDGAKKWMKRLSKFTKNKDNPCFMFTEMATELGVTSGRHTKANQEFDKHIESGGHNSFFEWQKEKGKARRNGEYDRYGPNIDIILPYWLRKYYYSSIAL